MDNLKWKINQFFQGRNGMDELARTIFWISFAVNIIAAIFGSQLLYYVAMIGLVYSMYRVFSKKLGERREENQKFLKKISLFRMKFAQRKDYRIFQCPSCGRNIRVPRGKGKIEVTCPVCGHKKIIRT